MPLLATRRAAVGCLAVLVAAVSAGPVWAQSKPKPAPKTSALPQAAQPAPPPAPPAPLHHPWVPEQVQERVSPFVVDVVLGTAGVGMLALLLVVSTWVPPGRRRSADPLDGLPA